MGIVTEPQTFEEWKQEGLERSESIRVAALLGTVLQIEIDHVVHAIEEEVFMELNQTGREEEKTISDVMAAYEVMRDAIRKLPGYENYDIAPHWVMHTLLTFNGEAPEPQETEERINVYGELPSSETKLSPFQKKLKEAEEWAEKLRKDPNNLRACYYLGEALEAARNRALRENLDAEARQQLDALQNVYDCATELSAGRNR